jgi:hypothetical protein
VWPWTVSAVTARDGHEIRMGDMVASMPTKVTFVLAPAEGSVNAPHAAVVQDEPGPVTGIGQVVTTTVATAAMPAVQANVKAPTPAVAASTTNVAATAAGEPSVVARVVSTGAARVAAGAGAVFAATVSSAGDAATSWETPVVAAGAVLMFSWAWERVARRRATVADVAGPFNLARAIGEE